MCRRLLSSWTGICLALNLVAYPEWVVACNVQDLSELGRPGARRDAMIANLRAMGPQGMGKALAYRQTVSEASGTLDEAIDRIAAQWNGHLSGLYWFTDWSAAQAESTRTGKPILALRMLGNLSDELSCANSRYFRSTLYADPRVAATMREGFVLHWQSVRPIPKVTIDFGDGRRLERTLTGNSAHLVVLADGTLLDALPGLYGPEAFVRWLRQITDLASQVGPLAVEERALAVQNHHRAATDRSSMLSDAPVQWSAEAQAQMRQELAPTAEAAMLAAVSKSGVERPLVRMVAKFTQSVADDQRKNENDLHRRIHEWFVSEQGLTVDGMTKRIYAELFLTPDSDPWLGLVPADTFTGIPGGGLTTAGP